MTLDASGNLGINTTSPVSKLTIAQNSATAAGQYTAPAAITLWNTNAAGSVGGTIAFGGAAPTSTPTAFFASVYSSVAASDASGTSGSLCFGTKANQAATSITERMRIDSSGNLGIGITPQASRGLLQVYATGDQTDESGAVSFGNTASGAMRMYFGVNNANSYTYIGSVKSGTAYNNLVLQPNGGNLLVGTTSADGQKGISLKPNFSEGSGQITFNRANTASTSFAFNFFNNASSVGNINYNNTSTAYVTSSDYRLKENIAPMTGALARVAALKPVTYSWKVDGSAGEGFIAHELAEVVPDCVTGEKDAVDADGNPVYQGIDTSFLVATLTAAIQELNAKVTALEAQLNK
jgi:hypothetical protein